MGKGQGIADEGGHSQARVGIEWPGAKERLHSVVDPVAIRVIPEAGADSRAMTRHPLGEAEAIRRSLQKFHHAAAECVAHQQVGHGMPVVVAIRGSALAERVGENRLHIAFKLGVFARIPIDRELRVEDRLVALPSDKPAISKPCAAHAGYSVAKLSNRAV